MTKAIMSISIEYELKIKFDEYAHDHKINRSIFIEKILRDAIKEGDVDEKLRLLEVKRESVKQMMRDIREGWYKLMKANKESGGKMIQIGRNWQEKHGLGEGIKDGKSS